MLGIVFFLLQAAAPVEAPAMVEPANAVAEVEAPMESAEIEPKMKKVCRKVADPRVGALMARQTVCKFVPLEPNKAD